MQPLVMSHRDKKAKVTSENDEGDKGAPVEATQAEEHEEDGGQLEEHAEQQEADDALEEGYKEELDGAVAALEEVQEKIRGVGLSPMPHVLPCIACHALAAEAPPPIL